MTIMWMHRQNRNKKRDVIIITVFDCNWSLEKYQRLFNEHDDVMTYSYVLRYCPFVGGIIDPNRLLSPWHDLTVMSYMHNTK